MSVRRTDKKRFSAFIQAETYDKVKNFTVENELITTRLNPSSVLEMGLNLFFKELETRSLEDIAGEYLAEYKEMDNRGVIDE